MFTYLDNALSLSNIQNGAVTSTTTPAGVDLKNAIGPVLESVQVPSGGTGTLAIQPVMSLDNSTFVNVPADAILDPITGLVTTFANIAGAAGGSQQVYLKRDELMRYVSLTFSPVGAVSVTVNAVEAHLRAYTSLAV